MADQVVDKLIIDVSVTGNATTELGNINKQLKNVGKEGKTSVDNNSFFSSLSMFAGKVAILGYAIKKTVSLFSGFVKESTAYTENLNLFRITFGDMADEAERFANTFSTALGLDVSQVIRNMGFFNQIATGFGLVEEKAYQLSETLTQISYDISSFFDISIEDSISKVQSGLAGELEPLRRIGYALDQATLQQLAYNLGIQKSIREMTQAEKAQLRTIAIYEQSKNVMGDLAGTIQSPANQLRILKQQFTLLSRSIGNIIIPLLTKTLPIINGVVQGLTSAFNTIAVTFGFKIGEGVRDTTLDMNNLSNAVEEVEKTTKKTLLPFDDFLSLTKDLGKDTSSEINLEIPTYDALSGLEKITQKSKEIADTIKNWFLEVDTDGNVIGLNQGMQSTLNIAKSILEIVKNLGSIVLDITKEFDISTYVKDLSIFLEKVSSLVSKLTEIKPLMDAIKISIEAGLTIATGGLYLIFKYWEEISTFIDNMKNSLIKFVTGIISTIVLFFKSISIMANVFIKVINLMLKPINALLSLFKINASLQIPTINTGSSKEVQGYATGGFTPEVTGTLFQVGENSKPELMGNIKGKNSVANVQSIESAMENASYRGMTRALSTLGGVTNNKEGKIVINVNGKELAEATVKDYANAFQRNYRMSLQPR